MAEYKGVALPPLRSLKMTCWACPSQWEGEFKDGRHFYGRYRFGGLTGEINGQRFYSGDIGDGLDGLMNTTDMLEHMGLEFKGSVTGTEGEILERFDDNEE